MPYHKQRKAANKGLKKKTSYLQKKDYVSRVLKFHRACNAANIVGLGANPLNQTGAAQHLALTFRLNQLPNYTEFTLLFDEYRIRKIEVSFMPVGTVWSPVAVGPNAQGVIATVIDTDDGNPLTALGDYEQYETFRVQPVVSTKTMKRVIYPRSAGYVEANGAAANLENKSNATWMDCSFATVDYFGLKIYIDQYSGINTAQTWQVFAKYYLEFRIVR